MKNQLTILNFTKKLPLESIVADLIFILINLLLVTQINNIVRANLKLFGILALPFQIFAISVSTIGFFGKDSLEYNRFYKKFWSSCFINKNYVEPDTFGMVIWWWLINFLMLFGFFWMGTIIKAILTEMNITLNIPNGAFDLLIVATMIINFIVMFSALSLTYHLSVIKNVGENKAARYISAITVMLFLTFLNAVMKESLIIVKPLFDESFFLISIVIDAFMFLPVRLVTYLKPPFSFIEVITFGLAYALFIKELLII